MTNAGPQAGYAPVNGLEMYCEIHDTGQPLVVLHGAYMTIETITPEAFAGSPMFRRLGGVMGDLAGLPKSQLAVLPGTTHFVPSGFAVLDRADWLVVMIGEFRDAPMPEVHGTAGGQS